MFGTKHSGIIAAAAAALLFVSGCGGGRSSDTSTVETGVGQNGGSLRTVQITPVPGTAFISRGTTFRLAWTPENPPPPTFEAALIRYKEARGEEPRTLETQRTQLDRQGDSFVWELQRTDDFDLDASGVYYLQLRSSGGDEVLATYLVSSDRSTGTAVPAAETRPGITGALTHTVQR